MDNNKDSQKTLMEQAPSACIICGSTARPAIRGMGGFVGPGFFRRRIFRSAGHRVLDYFGIGQCLLEVSKGRQNK
jgi:hypothetical protein